MQFILLILLGIIVENNLISKQWRMICLPCPGIHHFLQVPVGGGGGERGAMVITCTSHVILLPEYRKAILVCV